MRRNRLASKKINEASQRDIKLELDVRCQRKIELMLTKAYPEIAVLGEEENVGDIESELRWVVDPIDGTVNFTYGIPHACVSIALQQRLPSGTNMGRITKRSSVRCTIRLWKSFGRRSGAKRPSSTTSGYK